MKSAAKFRVVWVTTGTEGNAVRIARELTEGKAAACVNVVPSVRSFYRWKGKVEEAAEWLLLIKTSGQNLKSVEKIVRRHHTYEVPEILVLPLRQGSKSYLQWLAAETSQTHRRNHA